MTTTTGNAFVYKQDITITNVETWKSHSPMYIANVIYKHSKYYTSYNENTSFARPQLTNRKTSMIKAMQKSIIVITDPAHNLKQC